MLHTGLDGLRTGAWMSDVDAMLERLRDALARAQVQVKSLEDAIRSLEKARVVLPPNGLEANSTAIPRQDTQTPEWDPNAQRIRGALSPAKVAMIARDILIDVGKPLKRGALVKEMLKREVPLAGKDMSKNLGTILWRHPQLIVSLSGLGYWAKGIPLQGVYNPDDDVEGEDNSNF